MIRDSVTGEGHLHETKLVAAPWPVRLLSYGYSFQRGPDALNLTAVTLTLGNGHAIALVTAPPVGD